MSIGSKRPEVRLLSPRPARNPRPPGGMRRPPGVPALPHAGPTRPGRTGTGSTGVGLRPGASDRGLPAGCGRLPRAGGPLRRFPQSGRYRAPTLQEAAASGPPCSTGSTAGSSAGASAAIGRGSSSSSAGNRTRTACPRARAHARRPGARGPRVPQGVVLPRRGHQPVDSAGRGRTRGAVGHQVLPQGGPGRPLGTPRTHRAAPRRPALRRAGPAALTAGAVTGPATSRLGSGLMAWGLWVPRMAPSAELEL